VHNLLKGDAQLFGHLEGEGWRGHSLKGAVSSLLPGFRIQHCGQLSRDASGKLIAVLMVAPETELGWGAKGTRLVWLTFVPDGSFQEIHQVRQPVSGKPDWLPILERWCWHAPIASPALLFTRGINAGGYNNNRNQVETEIWLQIP